MYMVVQLKADGSYSHTMQGGMPSYDDAKVSAVSCQKSHKTAKFAIYKMECVALTRAIQEIDKGVMFIDVPIN